MQTDSKFVKSSITLRGRSVFSGRSIEVEVCDAHVTGVRDIPDAEGYLAPGFLDLQINGYGGTDYSSNLSSMKIAELVMKLARFGTTRHLATVITNTEESILGSIRSIVRAGEESSVVRDSVVGLHIEGPFISPRDGARGVHETAYIRPADYDEFLGWQDAAGGTIRILTLSPEDDKALELIRKVSATGVIVSLGHTDVAPELINQAIDAGARMSTHIGNGSPSMIPRLKNFIWTQLSDDRLTASMIADGHHIPPHTLRCFLRCKSLERSILVSVAAPLAGSPPGLYKWGNTDIEIYDDGHIGMSGTSNLAGAAHLLDTGVGTVQSVMGWPLGEAIKLATVNPGRLLNLPTWDADPIVGEKADLIAFREVEGSIAVDKAILCHHVLFEREKE